MKLLYSGCILKVILKEAHLHRTEKSIKIGQLQNDSNKSFEKK